MMNISSAWKVALAGLKKLQHGDLGTALNTKGKPSNAFVKKAFTILDRVDSACSQSIEAGEAALLGVLRYQEVVYQVASTMSLALSGQAWIAHRLLPPLAHLLDALMAIDNLDGLLPINPKLSISDKAKPVAYDQFISAKGIAAAMRQILTDVTALLQAGEQQAQPAPTADADRLSGRSSGSRSSSSSNNNSGGTPAGQSGFSTSARERSSSSSSSKSERTPSTHVLALAALRISITACACCHAASEPELHSSFFQAVKLAAAAMQYANKHIAAIPRDGSTTSTSTGSTTDEHLRLARAALHLLHEASGMSLSKADLDETVSQFKALPDVAWLARVSVAVHTHMQMISRAPDPLVRPAYTSDSANISEHEVALGCGSSGRSSRIKREQQACIKMSAADAWALVSTCESGLPLLPSHALLLEVLGCDLKLIEWLALTTAPEMDHPLAYGGVLPCVSCLAFNEQQPCSSAEQLQMQLLMGVLSLQWAGSMQHLVGANSFGRACTLASFVCESKIFEHLLVGNDQERLEAVQAALPTVSKAAGAQGSRGLDASVASVAAAVSSGGILADLLQLVMQLLHQLQPAVASEEPVEESGPSSNVTSTTIEGGTAEPAVRSSDSPSRAGYASSSSNSNTVLWCSALHGRDLSSTLQVSQVAASHLLNTAMSLSSCGLDPKSAAYASWLEAWAPHAAQLAAHIQAVQRADTKSSTEAKLRRLLLVLPTDLDNSNDADSKHKVLPIAAARATPGAAVQQQLLGLLFHRMKLVNNAYAAGAKLVLVGMLSGTILEAFAMIRSIGKVLAAQAAPGVAATAATQGQASSSTSTRPGKLGAGSPALLLPWLVLAGRCYLEVARKNLAVLQMRTDNLNCGSFMGVVEDTLQEYFLESVTDSDGVVPALHTTLPQLSALLQPPPPQQQQQQPVAAAQQQWQLLGQQLQQHLTRLGLDLQPLQQQLRATRQALKQHPGRCANTDELHVDVLNHLHALGSLLCALPFGEACNNPSCCNLAGLSERDLVKGSGKVCSGCHMARYCCRKPCQSEHWQQHKAVCKAIRAAKKQ